MLDELTLEAHASFALHFLTTPNLGELLGSLNDLAAAVDVGILSAALVREFLSSAAYRINAESRLWLLAQFIALHRLQQRSSQEPQFLRALSLQLSSSSTEIVGRIDPAEPEVVQDEDAKISTQLLPPFVRDELSSLVNQDSVTGLLAKFNVYVHI